MGRVAAPVVVDHGEVEEDGGEGEQESEDFVPAEGSSLVGLDGFCDEEDAPGERGEDVRGEGAEAGEEQQEGSEEAVGAGFGPVPAEQGEREEA